MDGRHSISLLPNNSMEPTRPAASNRV